MRHKHILLLLMFSLIVFSRQALADPAQTDQVIALAQKQITAYLAQLADVHCRETVTQQKLSSNGHVETTEKEQFDYLIMMNGNNDELQLNESRVETSPNGHKAVVMPMLVTNGVATVLMVFHPYYRDSFEFSAQPEVYLDGVQATPIHFSHVSGRRTPAALALRGREYPLDLQGTAWLNVKTGTVMRVEADLLRDMSDIGLRSLHLEVDYRPVNLGKQTATMPSVAVVDVTTPRQHWRNTHEFADYKLFSVAVEQDPKIQVRPAPPDTPETQSTPSSPKENQ